MSATVRFSGRTLLHVVSYSVIQPVDFSQCLKILWPTDPLLGNDRETNSETTTVARQWPVRQWIGWKAMFSGWSLPMAAHATVDTATEERCFQRGPCREVVSGSKFRA
jgi:hypothetical protein